MRSLANGRDDAREGRILALDLGERRIGLALSDPEGKLPARHWVYQRRSLPADLEYLHEVVVTEGVVEVVLGLPRNMDGSLGPRAEATLEFKKALEERLGMEVLLCDEELTTAEAERVLLEADLSRRKRKRVRDALAATLILQRHLARRLRK